MRITHMQISRQDPGFGAPFPERPSPDWHWRGTSLPTDAHPRGVDVFLRGSFRPVQESRVPLMIFDGACGFCTSAAEWLATRLKRPTRIMPWQRSDLAELGLDRDSALRTVWWIEPDGERLHSECAIARALSSCGWPWKIASRILLFPFVRPLTGAGYRLVARLRRKLPGTTPACARPLPMEEEQAPFLDFGRGK